MRRDQRARAAAGRVGCSTRGWIGGRAFSRETVRLRVDGTARPGSLYYPGAAEHSRFQRRSHCWFACVSGNKLCRVGMRRLLLLPLRGCWRYMALLGRGDFGGRRLSPGSACAPVIANVTHRCVVHYNSSIIYIGYVSHTHVVDRPVIIKGPVIPISARVPYTNVAETIVDTTIEADCGPPETGIPAIPAIQPAPVTRSPKVTRDRGELPSARNPVVTAHGVPSPITRSPDVAWGRAERLRINRQGRRTDGDKDADGGPGVSCRRRGQHRDCQKEQTYGGRGDSQCEMKEAFEVHE